MNELPLRKLFIYIDGKYIGPTTFSGEIVKQLKSLQKLDIINFEKITAMQIIYIKYVNA